MQRHGPTCHLLTCRNQQPHTLVLIKIEGVAEEDGLQAHLVSTFFVTCSNALPCGCK